MKKTQVVRAYYVLPCCLLLLNLANNLASYKTEMIHEPFLRVGAVIALVLFGGALVAYALSPALETVVRSLHHSSRREAGIVGEIAFLAVLGVLVFWLYYQYYVHGAESLLPHELWNPKGY